MTSTARISRAIVAATVLLAVGTAGVAFADDIHRAARDGDADEVARLLADGADPDATDRAGYTALHYAAQSGSIEIAGLLLDAGADIEAKAGTRDATPLELANSSREREMESFLKNRGAYFRVYHASLQINPLALLLSPLVGLTVQGQIDAFLGEHLGVYARGSYVSVSPDSLLASVAGIEQRGFGVNVGMAYYLADYSGLMFSAHGAYEQVTVTYEGNSRTVDLIGGAAIVGYRWNWGAFTLTPLAQIAIYPGAPGKIVLKETRYMEYYAMFSPISFGIGVMMGVTL